MTFEDMIMPLFMFIVGAAMPFSFKKRLDLGQSRDKLYLHVIKRTLILFLLGMVAQGNLLDFDASTFHIYSNTLQAIAVGYFVSAILLLEFGVLMQAVITAVFMLLFWLVMMHYPVPGHGIGQLTPGDNFAIWLDHIILGRFQDGTNYAWITQTLVFPATVMLGAFAGQWLGTERSGYKKVAGLAIGGMLCLAGGYVWSIWFPNIKHLWTSSFVLISGGYCLLLLAGFYLVIDVWQFKRWAFGFKVIGMNAIAVYMATMLFDFRNIGNVFVHGLEKWVGSGYLFVQHAAALVIIWLILYFLYRRKVFIRI
jgi:predicted acyltransferase